MLIAGMSGGSQGGAIALADGDSLVGVCAQDRVTRARAGEGDVGEPTAALELLLGRLGRSRGEIARTIVAPVAPASGGPAGERIDHHRAHACTAFLTSPFDDSAILICDRESPKISVWTGNGTTVTPVAWAWTGDGFSDVFTRLAAVFGFASAAADQRLEALARLVPGTTDLSLESLLSLEDDRLFVSPSLETVIAGRLRDARDDLMHRATIASALQTRLGDLLLELLARIQKHLGAERLCLGGSFFYHSSMNTRVKTAGLFNAVFVPIDPGNSGIAVGAALSACPVRQAPASPFLGPSYSPQETKEVLDNCKLQYEWISDEGAVGVAVQGLQEGHLVGWFNGGMEWGPRALGARCILANPLAPYVLENLNTFLKKRESWRGYALSGLLEALDEHFEGPTESPFMECDYRPRDPARFRHVLPAPGAAIRVHTVSPDGHLPFRRLLEAFGAATGVPFLVNTSFNGFHEPIVCSPRDAVRGFYGSGLDLLVMNQFVLRK